MCVCVQSFKLASNSTTENTRAMCEICLKLAIKTLKQR